MQLNREIRISVLSFRKGILHQSDKPGSFHPREFICIGLSHMSDHIFMTGTKCNIIVLCLVQAHLITATFFIRIVIGYWIIFPKTNGTDIIITIRPAVKGKISTAWAFIFFHVFTSTLPICLTPFSKSIAEIYEEIHRLHSDRPNEKVRAVAVSVVDPRKPESGGTIRSMQWQAVSQMSGMAAGGSVYALRYGMMTSSGGRGGAAMKSSTF